MKKFTYVFISILMFNALWADGKKITITGLVGMMASYGAPNVGLNPQEDDIRQYFVIIPDFDQKCDCDSIEWSDTKTSKEVELKDPMQIVFLGKNINLRIGVRYQMTGTIMQGIHGTYHHTPFLFCVESVKILRTQPVVRKREY